MTNTPPNDDRLQRGTDVIREIYGDYGEAFFDDLDAIAPALSEFIRGFSYGEVFTRPGLDPKVRELTVIAQLAALGTAPRQLKAHVKGALHFGATRQEVVEVMLSVAVYSGFPASFNALMQAKEVFDAMDSDES